MNNKQNFWKSLQEKYEEKNKALLNKERELRYRLEAMDVILRKASNSKPERFPVTSNQVQPKRSPQAKSDCFKYLSSTHSGSKSSNHQKITNQRKETRAINSENDPEEEPSLDKNTLGQFFFKHCELYENKICQIDTTADLSESFSSVKTRSVRVAIALQKRGITNKDIVSVCSDSTIDSLIPFIASTYLGAKIFNLDPLLCRANLTHLLTLVTPSVIFVDELHLSLIEKIFKQENLNTEIIILGKCENYLSFCDLVQPIPDEDKFRPVQLNVYDTALMTYSSGTTGLPKVVCHSHYSLLQMVMMSYKSNLCLDRVLHYTSFSWISGIIVLTAAFFAGNTRLFSNDDVGKSIFEIIEKYKIMAIFMTPYHAYNIINDKNSYSQKCDVSSLKAILTGGTPMSRQLFKKLSDLFKGTIILNGYGLTEVGIVSVFNIKEDIKFIQQQSDSCGKTCPGVTVKIVDPDTKEVLGPNKNGEVCIKSTAMMVGYHKYSSDSQCFEDDGYFNSGDLGYYDDNGCLYVTERIKDIFKYRSYPITPALIESILMEHSAVKEAAVFGIPQGEEGEAPAACVVLKENSKADQKDIENFVNERVSDIERLRGGIIFVDSLPRTPTGKIQRNKVKESIIKTM